MLLRKRKYTKRQRGTMWPGNSARFSEEGIELPSAGREGRGGGKCIKNTRSPGEGEEARAKSITGEKAQPKGAQSPKVRAACKGECGQQGGMW